MKRFFTAICMVSALLASASCAKQVVEATAAMKVNESTLEVPAKGGAATIEFAEELAYEVTVDKDWCSASVDGKVVTVTADANDSYESRYAGVIVRAGDVSMDFTVQQFGFYSTGFSPDEVIFAYSKGASYDIAYSYGDEITASTDADWVKLTVTADNLRIEVEESTVAGTPENPSRTAEVNWELGKDSGVITIVQNNASFLETDSNWTLRYGGVKDYYGESASFIYNDVADPDLSGKYSVYYVKKSEFTASGVEMDDFAMTVGQELKSELEDALDYLHENGYEDVVFDDFLQEESGYEVFDPIDKGDYIAFAIGFTEDALLTGHYAYAEFSVSGSGGGTATGYDAWLGEWSVTRGSSTDTWKISKLKDGESYTVTGIEGFDFPVTALYESDTFVIYSQDNIGTIELKNYGECPVGLFGGWGDDGDFSLGNYVICTGTLSGSTAKLSPGTVSFSDGSSYKLDKMHFIATVSGGYGGISEDSTPLPTTLTKVGGGSDNPGGTGSEAYNRWIGNWNVDSGAFTVTLGQNVADKSFNMRGWQMDYDYFKPAPVDFDSETGSITLYGNDDEPIASNVNIGAEEGACYLYLVGWFIHTNGKEYYITSGGEGAYDVATGTFQSDGSVKFTGNSFELSSGGEFTYCRFEYLAVAMSDDTAAYTLQGGPNDFPLTAVKAGSTSSVKMNGAASGAGSWVKCSKKDFVKISDLRGTAAKDADVIEPAGVLTPYPALPETSHAFRRPFFIK